MHDPASRFPDTFDSIEALEDVLTTPSLALREWVGKLEGDVVILGVAGKMGPTLAKLLRRAIVESGSASSTIGVARFSSEGVEADLQRVGIETIPCDLLDPDQLSKLPKVPNVIYLVGMKFGSTGQEARTWAVNTYLPGMVVQHFAGSRIAALSSGNVYPFVPVTTGGCTEDAPVGPVGEYAQSTLGRERIFHYWGEQTHTPVSLIRLNYATEMRYGVLLDIARQVFAGEPVDLTMGNLNCIWQGDANESTIMLLDAAEVPARVVNLTGPETLSVRRIAEYFGAKFDREPVFTGEEAKTALLNNSSRWHAEHGLPAVNALRIMDWLAHWVMIDGPTLSKPTHFQTRDGKF